MRKVVSSTFTLVRTGRCSIVAETYMKHLLFHRNKLLFSLLEYSAHISRCNQKQSEILAKISMTAEKTEKCCGVNKREKSTISDVPESCWPSQTQTPLESESRKSHLKFF